MHSASYFSIPPGCSFASDLAKGILAQAASPQALAQTQIFLPTRRAARALSAAFLQESEGQALLLPKIRAIGDEDEAPDTIILAGADDASLPPAMAEMRRLCLIARQVQSFPINGRRPTQAQSFALARALLQLLDQVQNAEFPIEEMEDLWPKELASHWQDIAQFLSILWRFWPQILEQEGAMDPVARRIALMARQCEIWQECPPQTAVILAGSTGTLPATQAMMKVVANLPLGKVVFPGIMPDIQETDWQAIAKDTVHPLHPLSQTFQALDIAPSDVALWPASSHQSERQIARQQFLQEVMRPASQTDKWRDNNHMSAALQEAKTYQGFRRLEVQDTQEEAAVISLLMRQSLETPDKSTILITADRQLARMVQSELQRFDIEIDDSAGEPLIQSAVGGFLHLLSRLIASDDIFADILSLSVHPFACGRTSRLSYRQAIDELNKHHLRGALPFADLAGLCAALPEQSPLRPFVADHVIAPLGPLFDLRDGGQKSLSHYATILGQVAEDFAATSDAGMAEAVLKLWSGPDGEAVAKLLQDMAQYGGDYPITAQAFCDILHEMLQMTEVRHPFQKQSRLAILGAVESRMVSADLVIISGLNEGVWPPSAQQDLWMNQTMAKAMGLPHRQWRIALSAHDFMMAASMPNVVITRSRRQNDRLTTPSRWLTRMDAVMTALKIDDLIAPKMPDDISEVLAWRGQVTPKPISPPEPRPPISWRPTRFSATEFDILIGDPYAIYAKKILRMRALAPLNDPPNAALKGTLFHKALHLFTQKYPQGQIGADKLDILLAMAKPLFDEWDRHYQVRHFWWPQFIAVAKWFLEVDNINREKGDYHFSEIQGQMYIRIGTREFIVTAKADRLIKHDEGAVSVIDYKTGTMPTKTNVTRGRATQMLIESAIVLAGGYEELNRVEALKELAYWKLSGRGSQAGEIKNVTPKDFAPETLQETITHLFSRFEDEDMPYYAEPDPRGRQAYSDYRHLSRIREWRVTEVNHDE